MPKFTTSLNKTSLGADANQEVVLSFSSEDLVDGMPVTLELDGLKPKNDLPTKALARYVYTVNGTGTQTITLVTTESTTTNKTCTIQLKADGFEDSAVMTVAQTAATYALKMTNATSQNQIYNSQVCYLLDQPLATNTTYTFKCHVRATSNINSLSIYLQQEPANEQNWDPQMQNITTQWKEITATITTDGKQYNVITFNIGKFVGDIYMDNVSLKRNGNNTELMKNNDFESGNCDGWFKKGNATFECVPEGYEP